MRRLLASVSLVAALFVAPSAAFALDPPTVTTPTPLPFYTNVLGAPTVHIEWSIVPGALSYDVLTGDSVGTNPETCPASPTAPANITPTLLTTSADFTLPSGVEGLSCVYVEADDLVAPSYTPVPVVVDRTEPTVTGVLQTAGDGCSATPFTLTDATATDGSAATVAPDVFTANGTPFSPLLPFPVPGNAYDPVTISVVGTDAAGNSSVPPPFITSGRVSDSTGPGPATLEVSTDPTQQKATLSWDPVANDGAPVTYRVRKKGPQGTVTQSSLTTPVDEPGLQVDATYEFTLEAVDACGRVSPSDPSAVRLVRLNDTTPPTAPIVANPTFDPASHVVTISWVPATDNIQVDHYEILRNGVPLGATDSTVFVDAAPTQHADLSYVVRAVDTNGNVADSAPAPISTPDWTPPTAPVPILSVQGTTVTLRWAPALDNVGVVGYDVVRDEKVRGSMTAAVRTFRDLDVGPGLHTWRVVARDDAQLTTSSAPLTRKIVKPVARASLVALKMAGTGRGAARYSLSGPSRLLLDLRIVGTLPRAKLRLYVASGHGRITVWRGTPGSSAPRLRLHSSLARQGFVTIQLGRPLHAGRVRLVLIASGRLVIVGTGKHKPAMSGG